MNTHTVVTCGRDTKAKRNEAYVRRLRARSEMHVQLSSAPPTPSGDRVVRVPGPSIGVTPTRRAATPSARDRRHTTQPTTDVRCPCRICRSRDSLINALATTIACAYCRWRSLRRTTARPARRHPALAHHPLQSIGDLHPPRRATRTACRHRDGRGHPANADAPTARHGRRGRDRVRSRTLLAEYHS